MPAGCLIERLRIESLTETVKDVVLASNPKSALKLLTASLEESLPERASSKHMAGRNLGCQEPAQSLKYYANAA
ncbi:MAG: hypothetical protein K0U59_00425 [Gammaproteobacteria bacterium]|nr:hypothetical protein [Gammaproteobacteria bacterium]